MAIINRYIQQSAGVDNITLEQLDDNHASAGLYKLEEPIAIYQDNSDESIFYIGSKVGTTLYKEYEDCSIIMNSSVFHSPDQPNDYEPMTQIIIPYNNNEPTIKEFFIRYNNVSGTWSTLTKYNSGESVRGIKTENGYYLVDNTNPYGPVVLSDRSKVDKLESYTFTEGANYKVGEIIPTSDNGINAQVLEIDPATGGILKIALVDEPLTSTKGINAVITVNTEIGGSLIEFDKYGRLVPSAFKGSYVKPYEFKYQDSYIFELDFDDTYDNSTLSGGSSDYGFGYIPFNLANSFNYSVTDKANGNLIKGTVDFDHEKPIYVPSVNAGNLVWYGYVDTAGKVQPVDSNANNYTAGDTFTFEVENITYHGTVVDCSQTPYQLTTDFPADAGASVTGTFDTITTSGSGVGLKVYIAPSIVEPCYNIGVKDIPDKSLVWSGIKVTVKESTTKLGIVHIPFVFKFDIKVNGITTHVVEYGKIAVAGLYGVRPAWTSSNYNTITPISDAAEDWHNGDKFTINILGTTYNGQIDDISTQPFTLHTDIPQNTSLQMTGSYLAIPVSPSTGEGLLIQIDTVPSYTYKLKNTYVDPHGGYDPAFYNNSQVDILLARQRVQAGTLNNIMAFAGLEGKFNELVRTESINSDPTKRSQYSIPTEEAVGEYVESLLDNDTIAGISSEWIGSGEEVSLIKASGDKASSVLVPYASTTQDGLIKKEMYDRVEKMSTEIDSLKGLDSIGAALGNKSSITQAKLNQAWTAAGKGTPVEGNKIINTSEGDNQGHNWMYLNMGGVTQWYDIGSGNVAIATNSIQGVVMGTEPSQTYNYYSTIVKQQGSAANFINETLTTTATSATQFKVRINNTDSQGNIVDYTLTPSSGADQLMLANVPFTKSHNTALYYNTTYQIDASSASGYVNQEGFKINGIPGDYVGYVLNSTLNPILCITNIPTKTQTDISGTYTTTSTTGSGTGLKVIVTSVPYKESITFRLNITSWENPCDTIEVADIDGHLKASGVNTLAEHVKFLNDNKADKKEILLTSNDESIIITKPEGFEDHPRFDLSFNLSASTTWITLTGLLDGVTSTWDLTPYLQGISTNNLEFYYGDGILFQGIDYTFNANVEVLAGGAGYAVGDIIMLNNDTRSAKVTAVGTAGEIVEAVITSSLPSTTEGHDAELSAQYIFTSLKDPVMDSASGRTFMCKGTKLSLVSDLSGVTNVVDPTGTLNCAVANNTATIGLNINNVFKANSSQPCYITLTTPNPGQGILTQGSLVNLLQGLTNNMTYVMKNAVWKYKTNANRVEIAVQDEAVTPKAGVDIITVRPSDLGQIAEYK